MSKNAEVILIGDSVYNTIGLVRSLGRCDAKIYIIIVGARDWCNIHKSKHIARGCTWMANSFSEVMPLLDNLKDSVKKKYLMCSFDAAAEWVDANEKYLNQYFITPCRGKALGKLFNKKEQCELAKECGLDVPKSIVHTVGEAIDIDSLPFPLLTKPLVSTEGSKADIHICKNALELQTVLKNEEKGKAFIFQEFIEKEYELNCIGIRTEKECTLACAIRKLRHYPDVYGAGAFAHVDRAENYNINIEGVRQFLDRSGYYGPFSVEFLHSKGKNYFMEVNFRNDGLAIAPTQAGINLYDSYIHNKDVESHNFRPIYMMNIDYDMQYRRDYGKPSVAEWIKDFRKAECFIDVDFHDLMPSLWRYIAFILRRIPGLHYKY